jgi:hypothetical protein
MSEFEVYMRNIKCKDCGHIVKYEDHAIGDDFTIDKYNCTSCGVNDYVSGEI